MYIHSINMYLQSPAVALNSPIISPEIIKDTP